MPIRIEISPLETQYVTLNGTAGYLRSVNASNMVMWLRVIKTGFEILPEDQREYLENLYQAAMAQNSLSTMKVGGEA